MNSYMNKHGIEVRIYRTSHWGHHDKDGNWHNMEQEVPMLCFQCKNMDSGESDEYGDCWTPPSCNMNIWMPKRTGTCKKFKSYKNKLGYNGNKT